MAFYNQSTWATIHQPITMLSSSSPSSSSSSTFSMMRSSSSSSSSPFFAKSVSLRFIGVVLLIGMYSLKNFRLSQPMHQIVQEQKLQQQQQQKTHLLLTESSSVSRSTTTTASSSSLPSSSSLSRSVNNKTTGMNSAVASLLSTSSQSTSLLALNTNGTTSISSSSSIGGSITTSTTTDSQGSSFDFAVSSYVQCRLQMEQYLYLVMTNWLQQDVPILLNSYLQPHATVLGTTTMTTTTTRTTMDKSPATSNIPHYHHLQFYYKALDPKKYKQWQQVGTWTCHYEYYNKTTIDDDDHHRHHHHHRQEKEEEALPAQLELFLEAEGTLTEMMVICPFQPPPPQKRQRQRLLQQVKSSSFQTDPKGVRPVLTHVTVRIDSQPENNGNQENTTGNVTFTYDVRPFQRCDELALREAPKPAPSTTTATSSTASSLSSPIHGETLPQTNTTASNPPLLSIGACTQIAGDENHYFLPQWIEYHKLLGVTHFWIYINEPWNGTSINRYIQQQQTPSIMEYVTFVPFDLRWRDHESHVQRWLWNLAFFQEAQNNECLYRGRQYGVDWMIMTDVDEFVHVEHPDFVNRTTQSPLLQDYFQQQKYTSSSSTVGGIVLNSIPYGRNRLLNHPLSTFLAASQEEVFLFDYVWRLRDPPESRPFSRWKNIIRPDKVGHLNIHYATHVAPGYTKENAQANDIRIDHFKKPWEKTFETDFDSQFETDFDFDSHLIADPHLQELFGLPVRQAINDQWGNTYREAEPLPLLLQQQT